MLKKYLNLKGRERNQIEMIFFSLTLGSIVGVGTSLLMPTFGHFKLLWVGSFFSGSLTPAIFYGITRYGLFDIEIASTESVTI